MKTVTLTDRDVLELNLLQKKLEQESRGREFLSGTNNASFARRTDEAKDASNALETIERILRQTK